MPEVIKGADVYGRLAGICKLKFLFNFIKICPLFNLNSSLYMTKKNYSF